MVGDDGDTPVELRSVAETPLIAPRLEFTTIGELPTFHAVIIRPRDFRSDHRYPVLNHVYGGPTSQMVRLSARGYLLDQWFADRGFIFVAIDARGTPGRGRDWQRVVKHDLIQIPLTDQVQAMRALGRRYREMDMERVGIFGWFFGGYFAAMAAMRAGDLFRVGVAGAPVTDWEDYDTHYTERYMGLPSDNPDGYRATRLQTHVERLERPLLLIHGTGDDNVYFMHSFKLADALFREGKPFEFLPLNGFTHMVPEAAVVHRLQTRIADFLAEHLAGGVALGGGQSVN